MPEKDTTKKPRGAAESTPREDDDDTRQDEPETSATRDDADDSREASAGDDSDKKPGDKRDDATEASEHEGSVAAARVAEALGVDDTGDALDNEAVEGVKAAEAASAPNRSARRREEAQRRRKKRVSGASTNDGEDLPKDRNARAKQLLIRRQEQAASPERRPINLLPGEMVDDALARSWSATGRWLRTNFNVLQWFILAGILGVGGFLVYTSRVEKKTGSASEGLTSAVAAQRGRILAEDKRSEEEKEVDATRVFATPEERTDAAVASYNKVIDQHPGTGAAILAKLGQAGVMLDKRDYGHALEAFNEVLSTTLSAADPDVKGRALEGVGFAKEGKGDLDDAMTAFKELEKVDAKGFKELGKYHQARLLAGKGEKDKAKEILVEILALKSGEKDPTKEALNPTDKGTLPGIDSQTFPYLKAVSQELLRSIDPTALPARSQLGGPGGSSISPEELQKLIKKAREAAEQKGGEPHDEP